jgi:hypothetical protein
MTPKSYLTLCDLAQAKDWKIAITVGSNTKPGDPRKLKDLVLVTDTEALAIGIRGNLDQASTKMINAALKRNA